ncbi:phosphatidylinositol-glycan biosynthesis class S protein-domain-containing protein [Mycena leptocephala]|nr:phosphatidylinositol-glycan biosynthesis class S protein-domain-containing protein [Mycena leptocephala]
MPPHVHPEGTTLRDPSRLFYQSEYNRRLIIASYWVVIIAAIPFAGNQLRFPVRINLENTQDASLSSSLQQLMDDRIQKSPQAWKGLDVKVRNQHDADEIVDSYIVQATDGIPLASERYLTYPMRSGTLPMLADALSVLLVPPTDAHRVAQYSPRYRLAFTLLNEDGAAGRAISSWDISGAISRSFCSFLFLFYSRTGLDFAPRSFIPNPHGLSVLHNFTIESQVQFHAPLAFSPVSLHDGYGLTPEDLTVFVNSAEWSLSSSVSNDPVLHFIVFIPSASRRPLQILDPNGLPSSSDAFLLPQWGGIVIYNPPPELQDNTPLPSSALHSVFSTFANQLLALLGVPNLPPDVQMDAPVLTGWQLDALLRRRALENAEGAQDTLKSIVKLGDVQDSLTALDQMYASASTSLNETLHQSADALTLASRAFFNPGMLALLYFPAEHKYAVYSPLFASAMIPLIATAVKEIRAWRKQQREAAQGVQ